MQKKTKDCITLRTGFCYRIQNNDEITNTKFLTIYYNWKDLKLNDNKHYSKITQTSYIVNVKKREGKPSTDDYELKH